MPPGGGGDTVDQESATVPAPPVALEIVGGPSPPTPAVALPDPVVLKYASAAATPNEQGEGENEEERAPHVASPLTRNRASASASESDAHARDGRRSGRFRERERRRRDGVVRELRWKSDRTIGLPIAEALPGVGRAPRDCRLVPRGQLEVEARVLVAVLGSAEVVQLQRAAVGGAHAGRVAGEILVLGRRRPCRSCWRLASAALPASTDSHVVCSVPLFEQPPAPLVSDGSHEGLAPVQAFTPER